jgi:hypothetical protein
MAKKQGERRHQNLREPDSRIPAGRGVSWNLTRQRPAESPEFPKVPYERVCALLGKVPR